MTPQEAFDKSVRGLASQGFRRAMGRAETGLTSCSYLDAKSVSRHVRLLDASTVKP